MAYRVIWPPKARADLVAAVKYVSQDNVDAAERLGLQIVDRADELAEFPCLGRPLKVPLFENIRVLAFRPYLIVYQVDDSAQEVIIHRIWHGARGEVEMD